MNWVVAGIITGVVVYGVDFVLWSKVFTGMEQFVTPLPPGQPMKMGPQLIKSFALALVFGIVVAGLYRHFKGSLWASGVLGGMEFGTILWLPLAFATIGNGVWFDRIRKLFMAQFWAWLIRLNVAGIVLALLLR